MKIKVNASKKYDVIVGKNILLSSGDIVTRAMPCGKYLIITDSGVPEKYADAVFASLSGTGAQACKYVFPQGEKNKNIRTLEKILSFLAESGFTRSDGIVAVGGGVVGDISGLAAALYMRGIKYAQIPTTLLAAIDSSVGGKTAVDTPAGKNLIGAFNQPSVVVCDVDTFSTLSKENLLSGMGEGVKYGVLEGGRLWDIVRNAEYDSEKKCLISHINGTFSCFDLVEFVSLCVEAKARVVEKDERESDLRKILNLGHSVGHAVEKLSRYKIPHGICVAKGLVKIAEAFPDHTDKKIADELKRIFNDLGIDHTCRYSAEKLISAMRADKKTTGDGISAVVIGGIGSPIIKNVSYGEMQTRLSGVVRVCNSSLSGEINAVPGKSHANRTLICSALSSEPTKIDGIRDSDDIKAMISCLRSIGARIEKKRDKTKVTPVNRTEWAHLFCGESGSALRFLLPVAGGLGIEAKFEGKGNLPHRPIDDLLDQMRSHGVFTEKLGENNLPLKTSGKMRGGDFEIDGGVSSQYITGLLLAAPVMDEDVNIIIKGELKSKEYVDITVSVMRDFGVSVERTERGFFVAGGQKYVSPGEISVEGDYSSAAFMLVAGVLGGNVGIYGLNENSVQGDRKEIDVLKRMGGNIKFEKGACIAQKSQLSGISFNAENIIDAVPALSIACAFARGESRISGVERLRIKESDRLQAVIDMINSLGGKAKYEGGEIIIEGKKTLPGGVVDGRGDHRIVMAAVVAGALCTGGAVVSSPDAVKKSYPDFYTDFKRIGGVILD